MTDSPRPPLPDLADQAERLVALGVHRVAGLSADGLRALGDRAGAGLLVLAPDLAPASALAPLLERQGRPGFVVVDMADVDDFAPSDGLVVPLAPAYLVEHLDRGDDLANRSPDEAVPALAAVGRSPLTLTEALHWVLQQPDVLERNHCFMAAGSRLRRADGRLDARVPAVWISNGTGRDGPSRHQAPKVGWCWAGNRHTWLGFASTTRRVPLARVDGAGSG